MRFSDFHIPGFVDTSPLKSIECYSEYGFDVYDVYNPKTSGCNYNYGSTFLIIGHLLRLNSAMAANIAWFFIILTSIIISIIIFYYLKVSILKKIILSTFIALSPGVSLLFERGNFDQLIFILIFLATLAFVRQFWLLSILIIALSVLIKFYTFPLLLYVIFICRNKLNKGLLILIVFLVSLIIIFDINRSTVPPSSGGCCQFGGGVFSYYFRYFGLTGNQEIWITIGIFLTLVLNYLLIRFPNKLTSSDLFIFKSSSASIQSLPHKFSEVMVEWCSLIYISIYLAGYNYDYKLIFFVCGGLILLRISKVPKKVFFLYLGNYLLILWASVGLGSALIENSEIFLLLVNIFQLIGDLFNLFLASLLSSIHIKSYRK